MAKRVSVFFGIFMVFMFVTVLRIFDVTTSTGLAETAKEQHNMKITLASTRGTVYDCKLDALVSNGADEYYAAVTPGARSAAALSTVFSGEKMDGICKMLEQGSPFAVKLPRKITAEGIDVFTVKKRYAEKQQAAHVIGYLNSNGEGAAGVERAFDSRLTDNQGKISVEYNVDAVNNLLKGEERKINDTSYLSKSGVVLTLDKTIQGIAEDAADKYLTKGAVIVARVPTCELRAVVSRPDFSPDNVAGVLSSSDAPLLNRAFSAYSVGSVFKLVTAASALESGVSPDFEYTCTGSENVDGRDFHCYNGESHGKENMEEAIANSCNTYFINLAQHIEISVLLKTAKSLGFGRTFELAPNMNSDGGELPSAGELSASARALANFSFGQGNLTATPLQVTAMVNAIASGGQFYEPSLYEGFVNDKLKYTETAEKKEGTKAISEKTAKLLMKFMKASVEHGTSVKAKPEKGGAGAKTATAQTGKYDDGVEINNSWITGFFPYENPQYVITVFSEDGVSGGSKCGPAFKAIADGIYNYENGGEGSSAQTRIIERKKRARGAFKTPWRVFTSLKI